MLFWFVVRIFVEIPWNCVLRLYFFLLNANPLFPQNDTTFIGCADARKRIIRTPTHQIPIKTEFRDALPGVSTSYVALIPSKFLPHSIEIEIKIGIEIGIEIALAIL